MILTLVNILCLLVIIIVVIVIMFSYFKTKDNLDKMQPIIPISNTLVNYMENVTVPKVTPS